MRASSRRGTQEPRRRCLRQVPDAATTSRLNQMNVLRHPLPVGKRQRLELRQVLQPVGHAPLLVGRRDVARYGAGIGVRVRYALDEGVGDRREQTGVEVPRLLRRDKKRQPILAALLGHRFQHLQSAGLVGLGDDYCVSQPLLFYAPACPYVSARRPVQTLPKKPAIADSRSGPLAPAAPTAAKPRTKRDHGRATPGTCPP